MMIHLKNGLSQQIQVSGIETIFFRNNLFDLSSHFNVFYYINRYKSENIVLCQGTYLGLSPLTKQYLPALDVWYTAQTIALIQVRLW